MKAIASLITWIAGSFTSWVAGYWSAKIAAVLSLVAIQVAIFAVAVGGIGAVVSGIEMVVNDDLERAMSWFVPDNTLDCMAAAFSAWIIRATFEYHASIVRLWSSVL